MRRLMLAIAAVAAVALSGGTASAQDYRNVIRDSGNGSGNVIVARNRGFWGGFDGGPQGVMSNRIINSGNGVGNVIRAGNFGGFQPGFGPVGFPGGFGGQPVGFPGGGFAPTGFGGFGGLNMNIITNSGNGVGNSVLTSNRNGVPGGININVITNSGNGAGNVIGAKNR